MSSHLLFDTHFIYLDPNYVTFLWLYVQITEQKIDNTNSEL